MARSQISSTVFVYVVAIIVVAVIFVMGLKFFMHSKDVLDQSQTIMLKNTLESDIVSVQQDFGSIKKRRYDVEPGLYLCFMDLTKKDEILQTELINYYPLMKDALESNVNHNVFVFTESDLDSFYLKPILVEQYPHFSCFFSQNNQMAITYEGKGTQVNIQKNIVTNATLGSEKTTILKSSDNMITIEIPKDANPSYPYLSIELIEYHDLTTDKRSDVYKITPSGITFEEPIILRTHFTLKNNECPKSLTYYQESLDGTEKLDTRSFEIDCVHNLVSFKISKFV